MKRMEKEGEESLVHDADGWKEWRHYGDDDAWYAWKWLQQDGDEEGIPMQFTRCRFQFQAEHKCGLRHNCKFSHNEIYHQMPFAAIRKSWGRFRPRKIYGGGYQLKNVWTR